MILNTGSRTDIPAFYSEWFINRLKAGYVLVRNPYYPKMIHKYLLSPDVIDCIVFCTKNPAPMLEKMDELKKYRTFWFVTITPYGRAVEPNVPDKHEVMESFKKLSQVSGRKRTAWRYDPVFISGAYDIAYHKRAFEKIACTLSGYTEMCVISFIDLYEKTKKNFPGIREVTQEEMEELAVYFKEVCDRYGMTLRTCHEDHGLAKYGIDISGCMTKEVLENAADITLKVPSHSLAREGCTCLLGSDIGAYNTCAHGCRYCYANDDMKLVYDNMKKHDPESPILTGYPAEDDVITEAVQKSWLERRITLDL